MGTLPASSGPRGAPERPSAEARPGSTKRGMTLAAESRKEKLRTVVAHHCAPRHLRRQAHRVRHVHLGGARAEPVEPGGHPGRHPGGLPCARARRHSCLRGVCEHGGRGRSKRRDRARCRARNIAAVKGQRRSSRKVDPLSYSMGYEKFDPSLRSRRSPAASPPPSRRDPARRGWRRYALRSPVPHSGCASGCGSGRRRDPRDRCFRAPGG